MRALAVFLSACIALATPPATAADADLGPLVASLVDDNVIPAYATFAEAAETLDATLEKACAAGTPATDEVRDAFAKTWLAWAGARHVAKGPVTFFDRGFRIEFWPDNRNRVERELIDLRAPDADPAGRIATASVAVQGFPALERVLWGDTPREDCAIARAISGNLRAMAADIAREWVVGDPPFRDTLVTPSLQIGVYASHEEALGALLVGIASSLESVQRMRLGRPMGEGSGKPRPKRAEAWRSGLSMDLIRADLAAVEGFYRNGGKGIDQALRSGGHDDLADLMERAFTTTTATADAIDKPLAEAVTDPALAPKLEELLTQVNAVKVLIEHEIGPALGIPAGFNALDGD